MKPEHSFLFLKSSCKMCWTIVYDFLVLSTIILQQTSRSFFKTCSTCEIFSNIFIVSLPFLSSSLIDSSPLLSLCHWNVVAWDIADLPNAFLYFCIFLLYYNRVSHKIESWHVPWPLLHESTNYACTKCGSSKTSELVFLKLGK